jgi:hypothetical protein
MKEMERVMCSEMGWGECESACRERVELGKGLGESEAVCSVNPKGNEYKMHKNDNDAGWIV